MCTVGGGRAVRRFLLTLRAPRLRNPRVYVCRGVSAARRGSVANEVTGKRFSGAGQEEEHTASQSGSNKNEPHAGDDT